MSQSISSPNGCFDKIPGEIKNQILSYIVPTDFTFTDFGSLETVRAGFHKTRGIDSETCPEMILPLMSVNKDFAAWVGEVFFGKNRFAFTNDSTFATFVKYTSRPSVTNVTWSVKQIHLYGRSNFVSLAPHYFSTIILDLVPWSDVHFTIFQYAPIETPRQLDRSLDLWNRVHGRLNGFSVRMGRMIIDSDSVTWPMLVKNGGAVNNLTLTLVYSKYDGPIPGRPIDACEVDGWGLEGADEK